LYNFSGKQPELSDYNAARLAWSVSPANSRNGAGADNSRRKQGGRQERVEATLKIAAALCASQ
jgi:hypothetical protein